VFEHTHRKDACVPLSDKLRNPVERASLSLHCVLGL
jgi:hypothetical protein